MHEFFLFSVDAKPQCSSDLECDIENMMDWLRYVTLMDQVGDRNDARAMREAIEQINYMAEHRLRASVSVKYKVTKAL